MVQPVLLKDTKIKVWCEISGAKNSGGIGKVFDSDVEPQFGGDYEHICEGCVSKACVY